jgi:hypothetical protein
MSSALFNGWWQNLRKQVERRMVEGRRVLQVRVPELGHPRWVRYAVQRGRRHMSQWGRQGWLRWRERRQEVQPKRRRWGRQESPVETDNKSLFCYLFEQGGGSNVTCDTGYLISQTPSVVNFDVNETCYKRLRSIFLTFRVNYLKVWRTI